MIDMTDMIDVVDVKDVIDITDIFLGKITYIYIILGPGYIIEKT